MTLSDLEGQAVWYFSKRYISENVACISYEYDMFTCESESVSDL